MGLVRLSNLIGNDNQVLSNVMNETMFRTRCCIPCIVQSYNADENTVECQPAVRERIIKEDGSTEYVNLPLLINVPVVFPSSAAFSLKFPIANGDECLVVFSDLSIDNFWLHSGVQNPVEVRRHDLSDGIAIPCKLSTVKNDTASPVSIEVANNDVTIKGPYGSVTGRQLYKLLSHTHTVTVDGATYTTSGPSL